jgi:hypothetical protein
MHKYNTTKINNNMEIEQINKTNMNAQIQQNTKQTKSTIIWK